ncbi:hypothetical protein ACWF94_31410 [Streptomyces sp. NPDC055078]
MTTRRPESVNLPSGPPPLDGPPRTARPAVRVRAPYARRTTAWRNRRA